MDTETTLKTWLIVIAIILLILTTDLGFNIGVNKKWLWLIAAIATLAIYLLWLLYPLTIK